jgi:virulence-associated protein E/bifunctional DNA primase/polymerase-like protein
MTATNIIPLPPLPTWRVAFNEAYYLSGALVIPINPKSKRPYLKEWPQRGSKDKAQLEAWWREWPQAMIGVLTGEPSGLWALDIDDKHDGSGSLAKLIASYGPLPATPAHKTPGGWRMWFKWPKGVTLKSRAGDIASGIDVRGGTASGLCKGQAIIPPSVRADGGRYEWEAPWSDLSDAKEAPSWLFFLAIFGRRDREKLAALGIDHKTLANLPPAEWQTAANDKLRPKAHETGEPIHDLNADDIAGVERYIRGAVKQICDTLRSTAPGTQDIELNNSALRIHGIIKGAQEIGFDTAQIEEWAYAHYIEACLGMTCDVDRDPWEIDHAEDKWRRTEGVAEPRDLRHLLTRQLEPISNGVERFIAWPDANDEGKPLPNSVRNIAALLEALRVDLRQNCFTGCAEIREGDEFIELGDPMLNKMWAAAQLKGLTTKFDSFARLISVAADSRRHHSVKEYLEGVRWDGQPRVDTWLTQYIGVADDPLARAFGRCALLGAVRRILQPGCKHDTMLVLEGPQGSLKSSAVAVLGGPFYGDSLKLGLSAKETIEASRGLWIIEIPELAGMSNKDIEAVKAQLSSQTDRARMAWGRIASAVPRQCVFFGTTNSSQYLRDPTGNRRFCPVRVGKIDLDGLRQGRDQLWAEAYHRAKAGEPNAIPEGLWAAAAEAQEQRRVISAMEERICELLEDVTGFFETGELWKALGCPDVAQRNPHQLTFKQTLDRLGWKQKRKRRPGAGRNEEAKHGYHNVPVDDAEWLVYQDGKIMTARERAKPMGHFGA